LKIHRLGGCDGAVSCSFETATPSGLSNVASPGEDYVPVTGVVSFLTGETEKEI
jgi:hypothetical protein